MSKLPEISVCLKKFIPAAELSTADPRVLSVVVFLNDRHIEGDHEILPLLEKYQQRQRITSTEEYHSVDPDSGFDDISIDETRQVVFLWPDFSKFLEDLDRLAATKKYKKTACEP